MEAGDRGRKRSNSSSFHGLSQWGILSLYIYIYIHIFMYTVLKEILFYWEDDESDHKSLGLDSL